MTNATPGTSPVAPSQNEGVKVPPPATPTPLVVPPTGAPTMAPNSLPTVSLPSAPGEKPAHPEPTTPEIKEVMEVSESGKVVNHDEKTAAPAAPAVPAVPIIPTPMAKPMTPPSMSAVPVSVPPLRTPPKVDSVPQPVPTPSPITTSPKTPNPAPLSMTASPVIPPKPDKVSTVTEPATPVTPPAANLVSPVTGAIPSVSVKAAGDDGSSPSVPPKASKLKFIAPLLLLLFLVIGGGAAFFLSQRSQDIQNQASSVTSKGAVEAVSCNQVQGWICDSANYSQALKVAVYYDEFKQENLVIVADANINRSDISAECGGTTAHGFSINLPASSIPNGQHQLIIKGIPVSSGNQLNTADMFTVPLASGVSSTAQCGDAVSSSCSVTFTAAAAPDSSIACVKETYADSLSNTAGQYNYSTRATSFNPGDVVVFKITMKNTGQEVQQFALKDVLTGENLNQVDFMDTSCGTYNESTRTITASTNPVQGGDAVVCGFRLRVKSSLTQALTVTNTAEITSGSLTASCTAPLTVSIPGSSPSPSPTPSVSPTPSPSPSPSPSPYTLVCGSSCTTTSQCVIDHSCYNGKCVLNTCANGTSCSDDMCRATSCGSSCSTNTDCPDNHTCSGNVCRLTTCVNGTSTCTSDSCQVLPPAGSNPTPTVVTQTQTIVAKPSPTVGCNVACNTNADCTESSHICVDTSSGRRCRLDSNVSSTTCSPIGETAIATPKPMDLPVAGSNDVLKALGIGAISVVLGIIGLLLL